MDGDNINITFQLVVTSTLTVSSLIIFFGYNNNHFALRIKKTHQLKNNVKVSENDSEKEREKIFTILSLILIIIILIFIAIFLIVKIRAILKNYFENKTLERRLFERDAIFKIHDGFKNVVNKKSTVIPENSDKDIFFEIIYSFVSSCFNEDIKFDFDKNKNFRNIYIFCSEESMKKICGIPDKNAIENNEEDNQKTKFKIYDKVEVDIDKDATVCLDQLILSFFYAFNFLIRDRSNDSFLQEIHNFLNIGLYEVMRLFAKYAKKVYFVADNDDEDAYGEYDYNFNNKKIIYGNFADLNNSTKYKEKEHQKNEIDNEEEKMNNSNSSLKIINEVKIELNNIKDKKNKITISHKQLLLSLSQLDGIKNKETLGQEGENQNKNKLPLPEDNKGQDQLGEGNSAPKIESQDHQNGEKKSGEIDTSKLNNSINNIDNLNNDSSSNFIPISSSTNINNNTNIIKPNIDNLGPGIPPVPHGPINLNGPHGSVNPPHVFIDHNGPHGFGTHGPNN